MLKLKHTMSTYVYMVRCREDKLNDPVNTANHKTINIIQNLKYRTPTKEFYSNTRTLNLSNLRK